MVVMPDPKSYKKEYDSSYNFHPMISEDVNYVLKYCCFLFHILPNIGLVFQNTRLSPIQICLFRHWSEYMFLKVQNTVIIHWITTYCRGFV